VVRAKSGGDSLFTRIGYLKWSLTRGVESIHSGVCLFPHSLSARGGWPSGGDDDPLRVSLIIYKDWVRMMLVSCFLLLTGLAGSGGGNLRGSDLEEQEKLQ